MTTAVIIIAELNFKYDVLPEWKQWQSQGVFLLLQKQENSHFTRVHVTFCHILI